MKLRMLLLTAVCLLATLSDSLAALRVISAFFGRPNKNEDVTRALRNYVENGVFGFRISGQNLGAKEHHYKEDYLRVIYEVDGRRYTTDGVEGQTFTFEGVRNAIPDRYFGLPGRAPFAETASIRIANGTNSGLTASSIDQHGAWRWQAEIPPGRTSTEVGIVGLEWVISNRNGAVVKKFRVNRGDNRVSLSGNSSQPAPANRDSSLRVENNTEAYVAVYALDRWKAWNWKGGLAPGAAYEANVPDGETWVVTTQTGRVVRQFETYSRMGTVRVAR